MALFLTPYGLACGPQAVLGAPAAPAISQLVASQGTVLPQQFAGASCLPQLPPGAGAAMQAQVPGVQAQVLLQPLVALQPLQQPLQQPVQQPLQPRPQRRPQQTAAAPMAAPGPLEIARAVESLYRDELRPFGRILRKRLAELAQAATGQVVDVGVKELRAACEACPWLAVQDMQGADWAALIAGQPESFVDVYSPEDVYPEALWAEAAAYFQSLWGDSMVLPGGRYMCAQVLAQRNLPFLAGRSLGQVSHIVQLAISQKKLLGYTNGTVVPYAHSQSRLKDRDAERQSSGVTRGKSVVATWAAMRGLLERLFQVVGADSQPIPLSNLKRLFRVKFNVELSETALGYAKLSELMQDPRLSEMCKVTLQGYGYVLAPLAQPAKRNHISLVEGLRLDEDSQLDAEAAAAAQRAAAARVAAFQAAAAHAAAGEAQGGASARRGGGRPPALEMDAIVSPPPSPTARRTAHLGDAHYSDACEAGSAGAVPWFATTPVRTPFTAAFPPTPSPTAADGLSLPRLLGSARAMPPSMGGDAPALARKSGGGSPVGEALAWASRAPLRPAPLASPATKLQAVRSPPPAVVAPRTLPPLTPGTMGSLGFSVRNTFLHQAMQPPTPMKVGSQDRARSLPRNTC